MMNIESIWKIIYVSIMYKYIIWISILLTLFVNEIYRAKLYFLFQFAVNISISIISGMLKSCSESFRIYYYYRVINVSDFVSFTL